MTAHGLAFQDGRLSWLLLDGGAVNFKRDTYVRRDKTQSVAVLQYFSRRGEGLGQNYEAPFESYYGFSLIDIINCDRRRNRKKYWNLIIIRFLKE